MQGQELMEQARESLGSKRVFGEPYEKNGVTVIPAARVIGGAGGGEGLNPDGTGTAEGKQRGTGAGYGMIGSPAGAYVIKGDKVTWIPAIDVNRLALGVQITLIVFFLVVRSIAKARATKA